MIESCAHVQFLLKMSSSSDRPTVRLVRSGHDPVDIQPSQVTPLSLARIFAVRGSSHKSSLRVRSCVGSPRVDERCTTRECNTGNLFPSK